MGLWAAGIVLVGVGAYFMFSGTGTPSTTDIANNAATGTNSAVACTMDAKMCPNGTYVGRTGPNCQFVCPTGTSTASNAGVNYPADLLK